MKEEIIGGFGGCECFPFGYTLVFTSNRIIAATPKTRYGRDLLEAVADFLDDHVYWETLKSRPPEDLLKESRWNFAMPYKEIEEVEIKKERKRSGIELLIGIKLKKESETEVLGLAKFGWVPWKRPKLLPASQVPMPITLKASFSSDKEKSLLNELNLIRSVLGDKLVVSEPKLPVKKEKLMAIPSKPLQEYPEELVKKYFTKYPHNPEGVLEFHISKKMKEGKTREQSVEELLNESE